MIKGELIAKADEGDNEAQYQLGLYYCRLNQKNEALYWIRHSAAQGNPKAKECLLEIIDKVH